MQHDLALNLHEGNKGCCAGTHMSCTDALGYPISKVLMSCVKC